MADAIAACVHCGFCLPACPTYQELGEEMDSPRGRIFMMKDALEENLPLEEVLPYVDRCLGCLACEPACPSGVPYRELITPFRGLAEKQRSRSWVDQFFRQAALQTLPYPFRFRASARLGKWFKRLGPILPQRLRGLLNLLPERIPKSRPLPAVTSARGARRARVALLAGCAQQVLAPEINHAAIKVLSLSGVEVVVPPGQSCCGALSAHTGADRQAKQLARKNLTALPRDVDCVLTTAAGCGSGMHEYPLWFRGEADEDAAMQLSGMTKDICGFLRELGELRFAPLANPIQVAYQDACHLNHGQGVSREPRQLLLQVEGLELLEIPGTSFCCGSAGAYNIEQPKIASQLGQQKAKAILSTGAAAVATGNIGCMVQIQQHLGLLGSRLPVRHTIEWLADSVLPQQHEGNLAE